MSLKTFLGMVLASQLSIGMATSPDIGVALTQGSFRVDDTRVVGNSTLFEGTTVETGATSSKFRMNDGTQLLVASGSKGTIYRGRLVLEKGIGQIENATEFTIEANGFRVFPDSAVAAARVALKDHNLIQVTTLRGSVRVTTLNGVVLAAVSAGTSGEFDAEKAGPPAPMTLTGCLSENKESHGKPCHTSLTFQRSR